MAPVQEKKPTVKQINCFLTCTLCDGYLIDATTITECLHTFCRSCIVQHFMKSVFCPVCDLQVDKLSPSAKLCPDPRKQLLVYKAVPRLYQKEMAMQEKFRKEHKKKKKSLPLLPRHLPENVIRDRIVDSVQLYGPEQRISLSLEYECDLPNGCNNEASGEKQVGNLKRYLQCPAAVTIYHLKKFIRLKYEISHKHEIVISYEGEPLQESCSLMDVAYQFFWEAKSPMRFTYCVVLRSAQKVFEQVNQEQEPVMTREQTPPPPSMKPKKLALKTSSAPAATAKNVIKSSATSSNSNTKKSLHRRQQRQRSAKTAAYKSLEAMDDETASEREDSSPPCKRRKFHKSPRWECEDTPFVPFTVYRSTRSGKTPKPSPIDTESRYLPRPGIKTVYSAAVSSSMNDDGVWSDTDLSETRSESRNCFVSSTKTCEATSSSSTQKTRSLNDSAKSRFSSTRKRTADIYEFNSNNEDTNEDSNTTVEYDFVYDDNKESESDTQETNSMFDKDVKSDQNISSKIQEIRPHSENTSVKQEANLKKQLGSPSNSSKSLDDQIGAKDRQVSRINLEQHFVLDDITEQDLEQHIEDSIEEVEIDADGELDHDDGVCHSQDDIDTMDTETASSCLVIAEEDDDGVVEEVIAAEENGHELVVLENPDQGDSSYTIADTTDAASRKLHEHPLTSHKRSFHSAKQTESSLAIEEDEPEILHEKVSRKKSKKTKHHHHHHHKHRHRHSPVMVVSSAEETPMKFTLKLRPTPSISPTNSSALKSPLNEKSKKLSMDTHLAKVDPCSTRQLLAPQTAVSKSFKVYTYSRKASSLKHSPNRSESPEIKSPTPEPLSPPGPEEFSPKSPTPEPLSPPASLPPAETESKEPRIFSEVTSSPLSRQSRSSTPGENADFDLDESKSRFSQLRAVRAKSSSAGENDMKRVKTPASLIISKVEAGETPPRVQHDTRKPALEILMLPPSPPSSNAEAEETDTLKKQDKFVVNSATGSASKTGRSVQSETKDRENSQSAALDLSGRAKHKDVTLSSKKPVNSVCDVAKGRLTVSTSPMAHEQDFILPMNNGNVAQPHDLGLVPNASLVAIRDLMSIGITSPEELTAKLMGSFASNGQVAKHPLIPSYASHSIGPLGVKQRVRPMPGLNDLFPNRRVGAIHVGSSTPRPGPNQSVRHIPNPSALFQRQHQQHHQQQESIKKHQGQLTEEQLKERYQLFQQNQAARAVQTYSRYNNALVSHKTYSSPNRGSGGVMRPAHITPTGQPFLTSAQINNNNNLLKSAIRSRSIEKVAAGLLSVRANSFPLEAQAGR